MQQPELYAKNSALQIADNHLLLTKYLNNVEWKKVKASVLDIGCGDGFATSNILLPLISEKCGDIVGCDKSEKMITYAKKMYSRGPVKFTVLDIGKKVIPKDWELKFDHVFSFFCLHLADLRVAFENIFNLLQQDGNLLVWYVYQGDTSKAQLNLSKYPIWKAYFSDQTIRTFEEVVNERKSPEDTKKMLADIGFSKHSVNVETLNYTFENMASFYAFLESIDLVAHNFNETEKSEYLKDYVNELKKMEHFKFYPKEDGDETVHLEYDLLVVYSAKV